MMELICNWIIEAVTALLVVTFNIISDVITFDLQAFSNNIPAASTLYEVLKGIGIGLAVSIAVFQIFKFFTLAIKDVKDRPIAILIRLFFAIGLIYFGNYILEIIFNVTAIIYGSIAENSQDLSGLFEAFSSPEQYILDGEIATDIIGINAAYGLITIVCSITLIIQFVKMMIEVVERFIILCLMIYSSPLAFSTVTSLSTLDIFKKWTSMYLSQCLLMILSVWGVRLFFDVLHYTGPDSDAMSVIGRVIYALAIVKVIKRFDGYLQQLGLNPAAVNGPGIFDSIAATAGTMFMLNRSGGAGGKGKAGERTPLGGYMHAMMNNHPMAVGVRAIRAGVSAASSATAGSRVAAFKQAATSSLKGTYLPKQGAAEQLADAAKQKDYRAVGSTVAQVAADKPKNPGESIGNAISNPIGAYSTGVSERRELEQAKQLMGDPKAANAYFAQSAKMGGGQTVTNQNGVDLATSAAKTLLGNKADAVFSPTDKVTGVSIKPAQYKNENGATVTGGYMATFDVTSKDGTTSQVRLTDQKGAMLEYEKSAQAPDGNEVQINRVMPPAAAGSASAPSAQPVTPVTTVYALRGEVDVKVAESRAELKPKPKPNPKPSDPGKRPGKKP